MLLKKTVRFIKKLFMKWSEDQVPSLSAALSYYMVFSFIPLIIICIAIAGLLFGKAAAQGQIIDQITGMIGRHDAQFVQAILVKADQPITAITTGILSFAFLIFGASGIFSELQSGLNKIWAVKARRKKGIMAVIKQRLISLSMVFVFAGILLSSLLLNSVVIAISGYLKTVLPYSVTMIIILNSLISLALMIILFASIYKILPNAEIKWRDVMIGSTVTALLFLIGKILMEIYLGKVKVASVYGAAGSLIVLLLWTYYSAQIFFLGAEFIELYTKNKTLKP